jgi:hypothetical protein
MEVSTKGRGWCNEEGNEETASEFLGKNEEEAVEEATLGVTCRDALVLSWFNSDEPIASGTKQQDRSNDGKFGP